MRYIRAERFPANLARLGPISARGPTGIVLAADWRRPSTRVLTKERAKPPRLGYQHPITDFEEPGLIRNLAVLGLGHPLAT